jgi:catechol 2,3-dioxygenase-like lactoylglutathione lyase family enzyme
MTIDIRGLCPLLQVFDMERAVRFYCDVLEFEVKSASPGGGWTLLERDDASLMLNTAYDTGERPAEPDPARVAAHVDTALFFDCPDLDDAYRQLRARGIDAEAPRVKPYGMRQLYLTDPDGYQLCLQCPVSND